jgi:hypothetical protein
MLDQPTCGLDPKRWFLHDGNAVWVVVTMTVLPCDDYMGDDYVSVPCIDEVVAFEDYDEAGAYMETCDPRRSPHRMMLMRRDMNYWHGVRY